MKVTIDKFTEAKKEAWREELVLLTYNESVADDFLDNNASDALKQRFHKTNEQCYLEYGDVMRVLVAYDYGTQLFTVHQRTFDNIDAVMEYVAAFFMLQKTKKKSLAFWKRPQYYTAEEAEAFLKN